jgi:zinc D-Ala-D-Ala carboxypeptidase
MNWLFKLLSLLVGTKPKPQPAGRVVGQTVNGLPIYATYKDYPWDAKRWPNFKPSEFDCKGTGTIAVDPSSLDKLQALRTRIGRPFTIVSGYRSPQHNKAVGGAARSKHMEGIAFDVHMGGINQEGFVQEARKLGFTGIGYYDTFTHIDTRERKATWDQRS